MSIADEERGYDMARDEIGHMSALRTEALAQTLHERFVANRLECRLQAANEALAEALSKLFEWEKYGRLTQDAMARQNAEINRLTKALQEERQEREEYTEKCDAIIEARNAEIDRLKRALLHEEMIVSLFRKKIIA